MRAGFNGIFSTRCNLFTYFQSFAALLQKLLLIFDSLIKYPLKIYIFPSLLLFIFKKNGGKQRRRVSFHFLRTRECDKKLAMTVSIVVYTPSCLLIYYNALKTRFIVAGVGGVCGRFQHFSIIWLD